MDQISVARVRTRESGSMLPYVSLWCDVSKTGTLLPTFEQQTYIIFTWQAAILAHDGRSNF